MSVYYINDEYLGKNCKCNASIENECICKADWKEYEPDEQPPEEANDK
jgi:hypothetical protein